MSDERERVDQEIMDMGAKNPRIERVMKLREEAERKSEAERLRSRRIQQEQEYIDQMSMVVDEHLRNTKDEQQYNEAFETRIRDEVYRMHGISEDKLEGMMQYRNAWAQGAAFALFFLSIVLFFLCGLLHGFGSDVCLFMAFYTAVEGTLLSNGKKKSVVFDALIKGLHMLLFPAMMVIFVCYELGFEEYAFLMPIFSVAGIVVLVLGAVSYFIYDPYRADRRSRKRADGYIWEMERTALKEVRMKEKEYDKEERKKEKQMDREERKAWLADLWERTSPDKKTEDTAAVSDSPAAEGTQSQKDDAAAEDKKAQSEKENDKGKK